MYENTRAETERQTEMFADNFYLIVLYLFFFSPCFRTRVKHTCCSFRSRLFCKVFKVIRFDNGSSYICYCIYIALRGLTDFCFPDGLGVRTDSYVWTFERVTQSEGNIVIKKKKIQSLRSYIGWLLKKSIFLRFRRTSGRSRVKSYD